MTSIDYLLIILILFFGWCGYILYRISQDIRENSRKINQHDGTQRVIANYIQEATHILDNSHIVKDIANNITKFSKVLENIRIPVMRLETSPFRVNVTEDIRASWIQARKDKIQMVEQQMMTAEQLLDYSDKLHEEFLEAERTEKKEEIKILRAKIEVVETIMRIKI